MTTSRCFSAVPGLILVFGLVGFVVLPYWSLPPRISTWAGEVAWILFAAQFVVAGAAWWLVRHAIPEQQRATAEQPGDRMLLVIAMLFLSLPFVMAVHAAWGRPIAACGDEEAQAQSVVGMVKQLQILCDNRGVNLHAGRFLTLLERIWLGVVVLLGLFLRRRPMWRRWLLRGLLVVVVAGAMGIILFGQHSMPFRVGLVRYPPMGRILGLLLGPLLGFHEIGFRFCSLVSWLLLCAGAWHATVSIGSRRAGVVVAFLTGCMPLPLHYASLSYVDMAFAACALFSFSWLVRQVMRSDQNPLNREMVMACLWGWLAFMWKDIGMVVWGMVLCLGGVFWLFGRKSGHPLRAVGAWIVFGVMFLASTIPYLIVRVVLLKMRTYGNDGRVLFTASSLLEYPKRCFLWLGPEVALLALLGAAWMLFQGKKFRKVFLACFLWLLGMNLFLAGDHSDWAGYARFGLVFMPPLIALAGAGVHAVLSKVSQRASFVAATLLMLAGLAALALANPFSGERFRQYGTDTFLPYGQAMEQVVRIKGQEASVLALQPLGWLQRPDAYYAYRAGLKQTPIKTEERPQINAAVIRDLFASGQLDALIVPVAGEWQRLPWEERQKFADDPLTQELLADTGLTTAALSEYQGNGLAVMIKADSPGGQ